MTLSALHAHHRNRVKLPALFFLCFSALFLRNCNSLHVRKSVGFISNFASVPLRSPLNMQASEYQAAEASAEIDVEAGEEAIDEKVRETIKGLKKQQQVVASPEDMAEREKETNAWKVMLYNDDIHSFQYVTECLARCVPQLSMAKAHTITVEAHRNGKTTILDTWRDKANLYCQELQKCGLTVCAIYNKGSEKKNT